MSVKGGTKLERVLKDLTRKLRSDEVKVGFLSGATYPDGTPVAMIAAVQEFGGTIEIPEHETTVVRKIDKEGNFLKGGRFVKRPQGNFETTHAVPAHTVTIPARPYFRAMIAQNRKSWGPALGKALIETEMDSAKSLGQMGEVMKGQLQQSILDTNSPPLAKSTIAKKGFDTPLVDTSHMLNSVDSEVGDDE